MSFSMDVSDVLPRSRHSDYGHILKSVAIPSAGLVWPAHPFSHYKMGVKPRQKPASLFYQLINKEDVSDLADRLMQKKIQSGGYVLG